MLTTRSLRSNLALTYAGIALLTAAVLGGILLSVLGGYYARSESVYLRAAAQRLVAQPPAGDSTDALASWARVAALSTQTRVRVYDAEGSLLVDSGSPRQVDPGELLGRGMGMGMGGRMRARELPEPLGGGIFGGADRRSTRTLTLALADGGTVQVSDPPASGRGVLVGVAQAWLVAAGLAVALAAFAGYAVSSRISRPIVELTDASDRMAEGDLTARAPVERTDEVGRLADSFNAMAGRIETTVTALRRFVADAAHEIGTPLTALQADLELAEQAAASDDERRLVGRALGQARRLELLSANLLRLSRIEAGERAGDAELVDVRQLVAEAVEAVASRAEQAGVDLVVDVPDAAAGSVAAQRSELQTVFGNLIDNALKFTAEGGTVTVRLARQDDAAIVTVTDTGVGIPAAEQSEVFSRFHRARNVAGYPGSGLGLAIVRATVERMGGSVSFESSEAGTEFRVVLPLV